MSVCETERTRGRIIEISPREREREGRREAERDIQRTGAELKASKRETMKVYLLPMLRAQAETDRDRETEAERDMER